MLQLTPLDVRQPIEQIADELQLLTEKHTIVLNLAQTPLVIDGDRLRIEQAIYNLVQNAMKYSSNGGTITVAAHEHGPMVVISVSDTGIDIPAPEVPRVFERFYRGSNTAHVGINRVGLGL